MSKFNAGDRVRIKTGLSLSKWAGYEFITRGETVDWSDDMEWLLHGNNRPDGDTCDFVWFASDLELISSSASLDDLRRVVDSLRQQGYTVTNVEVSEPPAPPVTHIL